MRRREKIKCATEAEGFNILNFVPLEGQYVQDKTVEILSSIASSPDTLEGEEKAALRVPL